MLSLMNNKEATDFLGWLCDADSGGTWHRLWRQFAAENLPASEDCDADKGGQKLVLLPRVCPTKGIR